MVVFKKEVVVLNKLLTYKCLIPFARRQHGDGSVIYFKRYHGPVQI